MDGGLSFSSDPSTNKMEKVTDFYSPSEPVTPTSNETTEKVTDSYSPSEHVTPTSNETMKPLRVLKVETEYSEMGFEKIKGVLEKLEETGDIKTWNEVTHGTVMVWGNFDPEKLKMELENAAGDAIKAITNPTKSIHSGGDGTAMAMNYDFDTDNFKSKSANMIKIYIRYRLPEMQLPEIADGRTEILNHSENTTFAEPQRSRVAETPVSEIADRHGYEGKSERRSSRIHFYKIPQSLLRGTQKLARGVQKLIH